MNHTKGTAGSRRNKRPERMCVVCREHKEKSELLRIVLTEEAGYALDPKGRMAGRGTYVCASEECVRRGYAKQIFEKNLGRKMPESFLKELLKEIGADG